MENCQEHNKALITQCTWCARKICETCVKNAKGKKLCDRCLAKFSQQGVQVASTTQKDGVISNTDPTLSQERIEEAKERLNPTKKRTGIRNVPGNNNW